MGKEVCRVGADPGRVWLHQDVWSGGSQLHSTAPHFPTPDSADLAGGLYMGSGVPVWEGSCDAA